MKSLFHIKKPGRWSGLTVVILAAVLLVIVLILQGNYTRNTMTHEMEGTSISDLITSKLRFREKLSQPEGLLQGQLWHAEQHLDNPDYPEWMLRHLVAEGGDQMIGAFMAFRPDYYPEKGRLFEPCVRRQGDSVVFKLIEHDYTESEFYQVAMRGDTVMWCDPYLDPEGTVVTTYALPVHDKQGEIVGVLGLDLTTDWIEQAVNIHHLYPSSFSLVLTANGDLITNQDTSALVKQVIAIINDSNVVKSERGDGTVMGFDFYDSIENDYGHVFYTPVTVKGKLQWQIAIVCYDDEVYGKFDKFMLPFMLLSLLGILILGLIVQRFVRSSRKWHDEQMALERIDSELHVAHEIQQQAIPRPLSEVDGGHTRLEVRGMLTPAREVGGDLYDYSLRNDKLFFCVGDVSGKGVPASMLMAVTLTLYRQASAHENNPARIMQLINEAVCHRNEANMFVTLFIGVLDMPTGRLRYCNAGHNPPLRLPSLTMLAAERPKLPVGVMEDFRYTMQECVLESGETLFLYTDGLTEAMNRDHRMYGEERMKNSLEAYAKMNPGTGQPSAEQLLKHVADSVQSFTEGVAQSDDLTMLVIRYSPSVETTLFSDRLTLRNDPKETPLLGEFIKHAGEKIACDAKAMHNVRLAVEEAVVNAMSYAYPKSTAGEIVVEIRWNGQSLRTIISDNGIPFDPTEATKVDTTLPVEERPIGGLGIFLVKQLADSVNYERVDGRNILTLTFKL